MKTTIDKIKDLPISENTARLIVCARELENIYNETSEVLTSIYCEEISGIIISNEICDAYEVMNKAILKFIMFSIEKNICYRNLKEV